MRVLEKAGLVQIDGREEVAEVSAVPDAQPAEPPAPDPAPPPAAPIDPSAPAMGVSEQRPFEDIYAEQSVPLSPFTAEKLLKILEGLAALEPASRKAAVLALDAADDAWTVDDALLDAQRKVKALNGAKLQVEDQAREALALAKAQVESREQRQQESVATIRKQIADLEALLEREVTRATEEKSALTEGARAAKDACQRETARLDVEIARLARIADIFASPAPAGTPRQ